MATRFQTKPAVWFWIVSVLLLLWELIGCYFCFQQIRLGADGIPGVTAFDRALYPNLPVWYNWTYAVAVGAGALGGLALLTQKRVAKPLFVVSLIALVIQYGWYFGTTGAIAAKGAGSAGFPVFIGVVGIVAIWVADTAIKRGWAR